MILFNFEKADNYWTFLWAFEGVWFWRALGGLLVFFFFSLDGKPVKACEADVSSQITAAHLVCMYKMGIGLLQYQVFYLTYSITAAVV